MTRSIKNTFAPINRIPSEVLSLIPDHYKRDKEEELIALTHVCRDWREIFISRASLWAFLNCTSFDKTNTYIQRSKGSPLEISLVTRPRTPRHEALSLIHPLIDRFKALTLSGSSHDILKVTQHFCSSAPLLEKLDIKVHRAGHVAIKSTIFGGNLSSLRELRLYKVFTKLPWRNMANLTTFDFRHVPGDKISATQLLDFLEHAPLLREIKLMDSLPRSSNVPAKRMVSLRHLRLLRIRARPVHSILLNHLHIPIGASVTQEFEYDCETSLVSDYFPKSLDNLDNISHVTSINLSFYSGMGMRLNGPSGSLYALGTWADGDLSPSISEHRILKSLNKFPISTTERLAITDYTASADPETGGSGAYEILLLLDNLRALTLTDSTSNSFILALNPDRNASNAMLCPQLEELVLPFRRTSIDELLEMAKARASRGAKLSTLVIVSPWGHAQEDVPHLESYVSRVEYRFRNISLRWDILPGEDDDDVYDSGW